MSSYADMSLDALIKKKREETREKRSKVRPQTFKPVPKKAPIIDARHKISSKNRTRFTDAREKLRQLAKQKDARYKLQHERAYVPEPVRSTFPRTGIFARSPATQSDSSRQVTSQPSATATSRIGYERQISTQSSNEAWSTEKPKLIEYQYIPTPQTSVVRDIQKIDKAPVDEEYVPLPLSMIKRKLSMQYNAITEAAEGYANKIAAMQRTAVADKEKTPQTLPELIPIPNKLAKATLRSEIKIERPRLEYRIIVSNLNHTVTGADIQELFEDVSLMMESRLVRPGIAEVIYQTQHDAQTAVDLYHNRHLDGQPMNCLLVTPKVPSTAARSCYTNNDEYCRPNLKVKVDLAALRKVGFRN